MIVHKLIQYFSTIEEGAFWLVSKIKAYGKFNVITIDIHHFNDYYVFELWIKESALSNTLYLYMNEDVYFTAEIAEGIWEEELYV